MTAILTLLTRLIDLAEYAIDTKQTREIETLRRRVKHLEELLAYREFVRREGERQAEANRIRGAAEREARSGQL